VRLQPDSATSPAESGEITPRKEVCKAGPERKFSGVGRRKFEVRPHKAPPVRQNGSRSGDLTRSGWSNRLRIQPPPLWGRKRQKRSFGPVPARPHRGTGRRAREWRKECCPVIDRLRSVGLRDEGSGLRRGRLGRIVVAAHYALAPIPVPPRPQPRPRPGLRLPPRPPRPVPEQLPSTSRRPARSSSAEFSSDKRGIATAAGILAGRVG
jgi:hypothetical protein